MKLKNVLLVVLVLAVVATSYFAGKGWQMAAWYGPAMKSQELYYESILTNYAQLTKRWEENSSLKENRISNLVATVSASEKIIGSQERQVKEMEKLISLLKEKNSIQEEGLAQKDEVISEQSEELKKMLEFLKRIRQLLEQHNEFKGL